MAADEPDRALTAADTVGLDECVQLLRGPSDERRFDFDPALSTALMHR